MDEFRLFVALVDAVCRVINSPLNTDKSNVAVLDVSPVEAFV